MKMKNRHSEQEIPEAKTMETPATESAVVKKSRFEFLHRGKKANDNNDSNQSETNIPETKQPRKNKHQRLIALGSSVAALALVLGVSVGAICSHQAPEPEVPVVEEEPEPEPEPEPEEKVDEPEINDNATYQVAPHKPRYMSIPSIGLNNIPVVEIGLSGEALGTPYSNYVIGWQYNSARPGQAGVSMMTGHGGDLGVGILKTLPRARVGDNIIFEMGDGRKYTYRIVEMVNKTRGSEANNYMDVAYESPQPGVPALTLITCTGQWLRNENTYLLRLFVRAVLVS